MTRTDSKPEFGSPPAQRHLATVSDPELGHLKSNRLLSIGFLHSPENAHLGLSRKASWRKQNPSKTRRMSGSWLAGRGKSMCRGWDTKAGHALKVVLLERNRDFGCTGTCCCCKNHVSPEAGRRSSCIGSSFTLPRTPNITHTPFAGVQGLATSAPEETSHSLGRVSGPQPPACLTAHVPHRPGTRASPPSRPTRTTCAGRASCSSSCRRSPRARPCAEASRPASTGSRSSWRL